MKIDRNKLATAIAVECAKVDAPGVTDIVSGFQRNALEGRYETVHDLHTQFLGHIQMPNHHVAFTALSQVYQRAVAGEFNVDKE